MSFVTHSEEMVHEKNVQGKEQRAPISDSERGEMERRSNSAIKA